MASEDLTPYLIDDNKGLRKENNELRKELDEITSDNERMEKSIPYLRGLLLGEKYLKESINNIFNEVMRERKFFHNEVRDFINFNNYIMFIIGSIWPIGYALYYFTKADFFAIYLFIASFTCLIYFFIFPHLAIIEKTNNLLDNKIKDMIKDYNKHQKNSDYLNELVEKC